MGQTVVRPGFDLFRAFVKIATSNGPRNDCSNDPNDHPWGPRDQRRAGVSPVVMAAGLGAPMLTFVDFLADFFFGFG